DRSLSAIDSAGLAPHELPWLYFLRGVRADLRGESAEAERAFEQATRSAVTEMQEAYFGSLVFRQRIQEVPASEEIAAELRDRWERFKGDAAAYPYAREYAVVLYNLDRVEEAVEVINEELLNEASGYGSHEKQHLRLLKGMIAGPETERGREVLREMIRFGEEREAMAIGLYLLSRSPERAEDTEFSEFLNTLISREEPHPLLGQLYLLRSQLALRRAERAREAGEAERAREQTALAEADARRMLDQFPGMRQIDKVYRLLAFATLQREPAQYRVAADFLTQLRDQTESAGERATLNRLIGDCYFLNNDFANAADFYEAAVSAQPGTGISGSLFLRLVTAELRAGRIESALLHVDQADFTGQISPEARWQVEWNVARALQAEGALEQALERVRLLVGDADNDRVPTYLDLRLQWLWLRLRLMSGESGESLVEAAGGLFDRIRAIPSETLGASEAGLLLTEIGLLRAKVLIAAGDSEAGLAALEILRAEHPESSAAERSYIVEADYFAEADEFEAARDRLTELASRYPESPFAAEALFEAALHAERLGSEGYREAVRLLDLIGQEYPESPLLFYARLRQGDLLRSMNDFASAQTIYENLINRYPEHPRRYLAEISRADCMMALARDNPGPWEDAAVALERLLDLPNLPVALQIEAGYKLGFAFAKREQSEQAKEAFVLMYTRFLEDPERPDDLDATGRYWMSRILLELGELYEREGNAVEAKRIYRQIVAYNLPGRDLAQSRSRSI
ncbi:MAG: tetratricopeptide repeat protein, partial [Verrucomicrobiota bacterium]